MWPRVCGRIAVTCGVVPRQPERFSIAGITPVMRVQRTIDGVGSHTAGRCRGGNFEVVAQASEKTGFVLLDRVPGELIIIN